MNSTPRNVSEDDLDRRLSAVARSAVSSAAAQVDVESDLTELHRLVDKGEPAVSNMAHSEARRRRPGVLAAAATIAVVGVAAMVIVVRERGENGPTVPATLPESGTTMPSEPAVIPEPDTITTPSEPTTSPAAPTSIPTQVDDLPIVDEVDPPLIEPVASASVNKVDNGGDEQIWVAVGSAEGYVVAQKGAGYLEIVGTGGTRRVDLAEQVVPLVVLGSVLYAQGETAVTDGQPSARFVAIALTGPNEGTVVSESLQNWNTYLELPVGAFAAGANGVVDQARDIGATVIDYVDENGDPVAPIGIELRLVAVDTAALFTAQPAVVTLDGKPTYRIRTDEADLADGTTGPLPAWSGNWGAYVPVLASNGTSLLATLNPAESSWVRIEANWQFAAQGPDGPVVVRDTGNTFEIASVDPIIDVRSQNEGQS